MSTDSASEPDNQTSQSHSKVEREKQPLCTESEILDEIRQVHDQVIANGVSQEEIQADFRKMADLVTRVSEKIVNLCAQHNSVVESVNLLRLSVESKLSGEDDSSLATVGEPSVPSDAKKKNKMTLAANTGKEGNTSDVPKRTDDVFVGKVADNVRNEASDSKMSYATCVRKDLHKNKFKKPDFPELPRASNSDPQGVLGNKIEETSKTAKPRQVCPPKIQESVAPRAAPSRASQQTEEVSATTSTKPKHGRSLSQTPVKPVREARSKSAASDGNKEKNSSETEALFKKAVILPTVPTTDQKPPVQKTTETSSCDESASSSSQKIENEPPRQVAISKPPSNSNDPQSAQDTSEAQLVPTDTSVIDDVLDVDDGPATIKTLASEGSTAPEDREADKSTHTAATSSFNDDPKMNESGDAKRPTVGDAPVLPKSSDSETAGNAEVVDAPELSNVSKRALKKEELAEQKRLRDIAKQQKKYKTRQENEAKRVAEEVVPAVHSNTPDTETEPSGASAQEQKVVTDQEDPHTKWQQRENKRLAEKTAKEAKEAKEAADRAEFDRLVKIYNRSTSWGDRSGDVHKHSAKEFDEAIVKDFMKRRTHSFQGKMNEDLAMKCSVLLDNLCPIILNEFFVVYIARRQFAFSLQIERDIYAAIESEEHFYKASCLLQSGETAKAKKYAENFVSNYIRIQDGIRNKRENFPDGYATYDIQQVIIDNHTMEMKRRATYELSRTIFAEMGTFFEKSKDYNPFFYLLSLEIFKFSKHSIIAFDAVALPILRSKGYTNEKIYARYMRLVARTCTISFD